MKKFSLTEQERESLIAHHRASSDGRERDRIKAILLRDDGWNSEKIAHALLLDRSTVNRHLLDYVEKQKLQNELRNNGDSIEIHSYSFIQLSSGELNLS